jgi:hypothetical protein
MMGITIGDRKADERSGVGQMGRALGFEQHLRLGDSAGDQQKQQELIGW